jgi:hypothetical protein
MAFPEKALQFCLQINKREKTISEIYNNSATVSEPNRLAQPKNQFPWELKKYFSSYESPTLVFACSQPRSSDKIYSIN